MSQSKSSGVMAFLDIALQVFTAALVVVLAARTFKRRLGGYTGDCLGAAQQVAEVSIYLGILASWSFT